MFENLIYFQNLGLINLEMAYEHKHLGP